MADEESLLCRVKEKAIETSLARSLLTGLHRGEESVSSTYKLTPLTHSLCWCVCALPLQFYSTRSTHSRENARLRFRSRQKKDVGVLFARVI